MFPNCSRFIHFNKCFPRVRGDVPRPRLPQIRSPRFSPRARGCSLPKIQRFAHVVVFPACAGMFPVPLRYSLGSDRFPRVRGDVPATDRPKHTWYSFSPRARGCSYPLYPPGPCPCVFPACAGMFRCGSGRHVAGVRFPRVRGDVPVPPMG